MGEDFDRAREAMSWRRSYCRTRKRMCEKYMSERRTRTGVRGAGKMESAALGIVERGNARFRGGRRDRSRTEVSLDMD